jgi:hypothetical protein
MLLDGDLARCEPNALLPAAARRRPHHPWPKTNVAGIAALARRFERAAAFSRLATHWRPLPT